MQNVYDNTLTSFAYILALLDQFLRDVSKHCQNQNIVAKLNKITVFTGNYIIIIVFNSEMLMRNSDTQLTYLFCVVGMTLGNTHCGGT